MEVVPTDDNGTVHFGGYNLAGKNTSTDGDVTSEGALLVCTIRTVINLLLDDNISILDAPM